MAVATKDLHTRLTGDPTSLERASQRGGRALSAMERESRRLERQQRATHAAMETVGRGMLVAGAAIAAGVALTVKAAIDWESAWAGVLKTVDGTDEQMAALEEDIRSLAGELPATHAEIAAVAEAAGQLGVSRGDVAGFTRVMIDMGEATNLAATDAATALARLMNIMQTAPDDVSRLGSAIVDLGNNSATTEAEIVEMALRIAGAGNTIGLTEADVLGFSAALSSVGIRAEAGGTAISRVFLNIDAAVREGGEHLELFAQTAGLTVDDFKRAYGQDAAGAINSFVLGLGRVQASGGDVNAILGELSLSEIRVSDALRRLSGAGNLLTRSLETGSSAWEENIALTQEAERRYQTTEARMKIARNQVTDFAISVGQTLLPAVGEMADTIAAFADLLGQLPGPLKATLAVVGALAAATLLLGGALLLTIPRIAATKAALDQLALGAGRTAAAARGLNAALATTGRFLGGPWGIALAAAVVALGVFATKQSEAKARIDDLASTLDQQTGAITDNTRAFVANQLEQRGLLESAEALGLDLATVTDAILGEEEALAELDRVTQANIDTNIRQVRMLEKYGITLDESTSHADNLRRGVFGLTGDLDEATAATLRQAEAAGQDADAMEALDPETRLLAEGLGLTAGAADAASDSLDNLDKELQALFDRVFGLSRAQDELTEAFRKAKEQFNENSAGLEGNSEAAIANRRTAEELLEAYGNLAIETLKNTTSQQEAEGVAKDFEAALADLAAETGVNIEELEGYNAVVDEIERQVKVHFETSGLTAAEKRARELQNAIDRMTRHPHIIEIQTVTTAPVGGRSQFRQHGGWVHGPSTPADRVPVMATGGEFVVRRQVAQENAAALEFSNRTGARLAVAGTGVSGGDGAAAMSGGMPGEFTASAVLDLGEGIERVVDIKFQRHDRQLRRRVQAGAGAAR